MKNRACYSLSQSGKLSDEETHIDEETGEVVSVEPRYEIVCGERRFRAWNMLAKKF